MIHGGLAATPSLPFGGSVAENAGWATVAEGLLIVVLVAQTFSMRAVRRAGERRRVAVTRAWRPRFVEALQGIEAPVPAVSRADAVWLVALFNEYHSLLVGEACDRLNDFARRAGVDRAARRLLDSPGLKDRLVALQALGKMRDEEDWETLARLVHHHNRPLSLSAARALLCIDAARAVAVVVPAVAAREDWSPAQVARILREAGAEHSSAPLAAAAMAAGPRLQSRLVRLLEGALAEHALPAVRGILGSGPDEETICACLLILGHFSDPDDRERVRAQFRHRSSKVRIRAVSALGRIGDSRDRDALSGMLSDTEWWVRYRAAEALALLPGMQVSELRRIQSQMSDSFARDILEHVLAEEALR